MSVEPEKAIDLAGDLDTQSKKMKKDLDRVKADIRTETKAQKADKLYGTRYFVEAKPHVPSVPCVLGHVIHANFKRDVILWYAKLGG